MANKIDDSSDLLQITKNETAVSKNYRALSVDIYYVV